MMGERSPPDGGVRAYTVVAASFLCNGLIFGIINTYSVIYVKIQKEFTDNGVADASAKASLVGSLTIGVTFLMSPLSGILIDRIGIKMTTFIGGAIACSSFFIASFFTQNVMMLYLTYGLLFGLGSSLTYTPSLTILGHYFSKYIGIVNGIVSSGSSIFTMLMPYLVEYLLANFGLAQSLRYEAAMLSLLMLCSLAFKSVYPRASKSKDPSKSKTSQNYITSLLNMNIWKSKKYILWISVVPLALTGYFVIFVHLAKYVANQFANENKNLPLTCLAVTSLIGRIIFGRLSDLKRVDSVILQQISLFMMGLIMMLIPTSTHYWMIIALAMVFGLFDGCFVSVVGPIAFQLCGPKGAGQAIGFILGLCSIPMTIGPPIAGWIYDRTNTYTIPFILSGIPLILGSLLLTKIHFMKSYEPDYRAASSMEEKTLNHTGDVEADIKINE